MVRNKFRFLDEIATADAAFEASGNSINELFENSALAMFSVMAPLELIGTTSVRDVTLSAESVEELLFKWLAELVYLKDVHGELYSVFKVRIEQRDGFTLAAEIRGDSIDSVREHTHTDVKAVTYHRLSIRQDETGFTATVVLDL